MSPRPTLFPRPTVARPTGRRATLPRPRAAALFAAAFCAACVGAAGLAAAQERPAPAAGSSSSERPVSEEGGAKGHHRPPPEALAACSASQAGAACSFTSPRGAVSGSCWAPEGKPLACRPAHGHPGQAQAQQGPEPGERPSP
jgi:hypothetical protein